VPYPQDSSCREPNASTKIKVSPDSQNPSKSPFVKGGPRGIRVGSAHHSIGEHSPPYRFCLVIASEAKQSLTTSCHINDKIATSLRSSQ
jgi:hypothetical protein